MSVRGVERRKLVKIGNSFYASLILRELREDGVVERGEDGEWELADEDAEVVVQHHDDGTAVVQLPPKEGPRHPAR